jgi:acetyl esterase/lipase
MKYLIALFAVATSTFAVDKPVIDLWPAGLPRGSVQFSADKIAAAKKKTTEERIAFVDQPSLTLFRAPADKANGAGLIICPGGAYNILAWPKEGLEVAEYFNSVGVTCAVLQYRVPRRNPDTPHVEPLQDAQRAIRLMRHNGKAWGVDPERVGILGFSAGGHLTTMAGLHFKKPAYPGTDDVDKQSARPDFICPIYPAYYADERTPAPLDALMKVTKETPPTFIAVTSDDKLRGYNSAQFYLELKKAGVPAELHVYSLGGHGYGIRPSDKPISKWHHRCSDWMRAMGLFEWK